MPKKTNSYLFLIFAFFFILGCQQRREAKRNEEVIPVRVTRVNLEELEETLDYVGNVKALEEAVVYPEVDGKIIEKVKEEGQLVKKGDPLAYIDRDEVGLKFEKAPVESPLEGIVGKVYVDIGTNVTIQTPIALVVDMRKAQIDLDIPEKYLPQISVGQEAKVRVDAYPDETFTGKVTKISPVVDLDTRTAPIEITLPNEQFRLKSGMFAEVSLVIREHKGVPVILKEAILGKNSSVYVYVIENNKAVSRKISLGIRQGPLYEVKKGLTKGDQVVIMGQQRLYEGAPVKAEESD
jgi:multidrug efflux pump subunit AcrA (membrane-fusion protein)